MVITPSLPFVPWCIGQGRKERELIVGYEGLFGTLERWAIL